MKSEERFRDYAPLAWFYDRYWGERYRALVLPILDRHPAPTPGAQSGGNSVRDEL